jgi:hypothetical protein
MRLARKFIGKDHAKIEISGDGSLFYDTAAFVQEGKSVQVTAPPARSIACVCVCVSVIV